MGLKDVILLSLSAAMVIVGTHITMTQGIMFSYPVFMLAVALLLWFKVRKTDLREGKPKKDNLKKRKRH